MELKHWECHTDYYYTIQTYENNSFVINIFENVGATKNIFINRNNRTSEKLDNYGNITINSNDIESSIYDLIWSIITYKQ